MDGSFVKGPNPRLFVLRWWPNGTLEPVDPKTHGTVGRTVSSGRVVVAIWDDSDAR